MIFMNTFQKQEDNSFSTILIKYELKNKVLVELMDLSWKINLSR